MQVQMWEWLNHQANQNFTNADQMTKWVMGMLQLQEALNRRKEAYGEISRL